MRTRDLADVEEELNWWLPRTSRRHEVIPVRARTIPTYTFIMSVISVVRLAPAAAVARRASIPASASASASPFLVGASPRGALKLPARFNARAIPGGVAYAAASSVNDFNDFNDPRQSPIARMAAGLDSPTKAPTPNPFLCGLKGFDAVVAAILEWRKGLACAAFAVVLALSDCGAAQAGHTWRPSCSPI